MAKELDNSLAFLEDAPAPAAVAPAVVVEEPVVDALEGAIGELLKDEAVAKAYERFKAAVESVSGRSPRMHSLLGMIRPDNAGDIFVALRERYRGTEAYVALKALESLVKAKQAPVTEAIPQSVKDSLESIRNAVASVDKAAKEKVVEQLRALAVEVARAFKGEEPKAATESKVAALKKLKETYTGKIDDEEIRMWILNDEGLYNWARSEGVSEDAIGDSSSAAFNKFVDENHAELISSIKRAMGKESKTLPAGKKAKLEEASDPMAKAEADLEYAILAYGEYALGLEGSELHTFVATSLDSVKSSGGSSMGMGGGMDMSGMGAPLPPMGGDLPSEMNLDTLGDLAAEAPAEEPAAEEPEEKPKKKD